MERPANRDGADPRADVNALEGFVRSLVGVGNASVELGRDGRPAVIHVVPSPGASERQVRLNVISALMAGPGLAVDASALRVVDSLPVPAPPVPTTAVALAEPLPAPVTNGKHATNGKPATNGTAAVAHHHAAPVEPEPHRNGRQAQVAHAMAAGPPAGRALSLTRFELEAPAPGRIRVIVGMTADGRSGLGVREADERPGVAVELAARAAADAARAAGVLEAAFQLAGVSLTEVAGRTHVVAAVDLWTGADFAACPGAAAVLASYEEAAARAVLAALSRY
jgi:hypothetical protein